jgi:hypothetical protein
VRFWKYHVPVVLLQVTVIVLVLAGFLQIPGLVKTSATIVSWVPLMTLFGQLAGIAMLSRSKLQSVLKGKVLMDRASDAWILLVMVVVGFVGVFQGITSPSYSWIFSNLGLIYEAAAQSLMAFFGASAMWRVLKLKNSMSIFFAAGLFLTLLTATALGETIWSGYPTLVSFVTGTVNMASIRAIGISIALGLVATGFRTMTGIERTYVGRE